MDFIDLDQGKVQSEAFVNSVTLEFHKARNLLSGWIINSLMNNMHHGS
jgi:hypothetical protein